MGRRSDEASASWPSACVVVPVKQSQATIRRTVESLLAQDYPGLFAVKLVGDRGDATWEALGGLLGDQRLECLELRRPVSGRDVNVKRNVGLGSTDAEILALTDSDMVLRPDWLRSAVSILRQGNDCAAGGMESTHDDYWGLYVDRNVFGAKTPRVPADYTVTRDNFGHLRRKPPITANVVFTRRLWDEIGPFDPSFQRYEDYEWFWRVVAGGHEIRFVRCLVGGHHHRRGVRTLARDYWHSGRGCAEFIRTHGESPLARRRLAQLAAVTLAVIGTAGACLLTPPADVALSVAGLLAVLGAVEAIVTRRLRALSFPAVTLVLGLAFAAGAGNRLMRRTPDLRATAGPNRSPLAELHTAHAAEQPADSVTSVLEAGAAVATAAHGEGLR